MYYRDHRPPHFHAIYGYKEAIFNIDTLDMVKGDLPKRAKTMVVEWAIEHRTTLKENWKRTKQHKELLQIDPLD